MPRPLVAGNWKMNTDLSEAIELGTQFSQRIGVTKRVRTVICPPAVFLSTLSNLLQGTGIALGAQNMHPELRGAFTGEISTTMIKQWCEFVILGHSERRQLFSETDNFINLKVKTALESELSPILCVGETLEQRESGDTERVVATQVRIALQSIARSEVPKVIIAYEPIWAIGTGRAATPAMAQEVMSMIRSELRIKTNSAEAKEVVLLYGGSVNAESAPELAKQGDINGALVGGASLNVAAFSEIVTAFDNGA